MISGHRRRYKAATGNRDEFIDWRAGKKKNKRSRIIESHLLRAYQKKIDSIELNM